MLLLLLLMPQCVEDTWVWCTRIIFFLQNSRRQINYSMKCFVIVPSMNIEVFVVALVNDSTG